MRIVVGAVRQEQNSFSPKLTDYGDFESRNLLRGDEILTRLERYGEMGGVMRAAKEQGVELVPTLLAGCLTAGPIVRSAYERLKDELLTRIRAVSQYDGVFLPMHGATAAEGVPDVTGDILAEVRTIAGDRPVVASLDLHANVTPKMVKAATALVGYHTVPHVDQVETGYRAGQVLFDAVRGRVRPVMGYYRLPLLHAPEVGSTEVGPMAEMRQEAEALEKRPGILHVGIYPVQPWLDVPELATTVVVVADSQRDRAQAEAERLARMLWERRDRLVANSVPIKDAIAHAASLDGGTVVVSDPGDAPTGGGVGDSTAILQAMLEAGIPCTALLTIVDPEAVATAIAAGIGSEVTLTLGGKIDRTFSKPVQVIGRVRTVSDGRFTYKSPVSPGAPGNMGRTVVLQVGKISLVVCERAVAHYDPQTYRYLGLEPADARIVQAKNLAAFVAAYAPIAREIMWLDTPGVTTSNFKILPFKHAPRPLFPIDAVPDEAVFPKTAERG